MSGSQSKITRKIKKKVREKVLDFIEDEDFLMKRTLQLLLEKYEVEDHNIYHTITHNAVNKLEGEDKIRTAKFPKKGSYPIWVYREDLRLRDFQDQIMEEYLPVWRKFSEASSGIGSYAEDIIEMALKKADFTTVSKEGHTKYFNFKKYEGNDLDFIAFKDGIFYGIEVKNKLPHPDFEDEIMAKKDVADFHGIQFVLVSRNSGRNGMRLFNEGGLHVDYGYYIWDPNFSRIAERSKEKLKYPLKPLSSPPEDLIEEINKVPEWHEKHFPEKGRI